MNSPKDPVIIIGAGIAGLVAALSLYPRKALLVTGMPMGQGAASGWSQGGIAAALLPNDSPDLHAADTMRAAAGIADEEVVRLITHEAVSVISYLESQGVIFDKSENGGYALSKEAAHLFPRVLRVAGDLTGPGIMAALRKKVMAAEHISLMQGFNLSGFLVAENKMQGVYLHRAALPQNNAEFYSAKHVILATGGIGYLYAQTSNPVTACGDGIAAAAQAGAVLADMEFVQFHPTTLQVGKDPAPLATEALRGEGATLINAAGTRFLQNWHKDAELAPRDIVARAIFAELQKGETVYLDCRKAIGKDFQKRFPKVYELCKEAGIDPVSHPIPVAPAAHYHMGGVATDMDARTSINGLWACGEVACTGAHGANRLASNSLLEAVVFARRAAESILGQEAAIIRITSPEFKSGNLILSPQDQATTQELRQLMTGNAGLIKNHAGLTAALEKLDRIESAEALSLPLRNRILVCRLIVTGALWREESRGSHYRTDFPDTQKSWQKRQFITSEMIKEKSPQKLEVAYA